MQSSDESSPSCPGPSMWNLITEHVGSSEVPKIRTALGQSLVKTYIDLHSETKTLSALLLLEYHNIYKNFSLQRAEMFYKMWQESQRRDNHGSRAGSITQWQRGSPLPDPPAVKELVRAEVKMLLQTLRERASKRGRDAEDLLLRYNPDTVNYALSHLDGTSRRECDNGSKTEERPRPNSHCSVQSCIEDDIEAVSDSLNVAHIDQVAERLRFVMLEQCEALKRLVQHLKENIKPSSRRESEVPKPEPTLLELRMLRGAVQKDLNSYPPSHAVPNTQLFHLPVKEIKNKFRGRVASADTLQILNAASAFRPHPPPPLLHANPRPPAGPPHTRMSASIRQIQTASLSGTHGQRMRISLISESSRTPGRNPIATTE